MKLTENGVFIGVVILALTATLMAYVVEYPNEKEVTIRSVPTPAEPPNTGPTTIPPTTTITTPPVQEFPEQQVVAETTTTSTTTPSSTTLAGVTNTYLSKYTEKGYRQAYMNITFFCPSCVPAVAANLRNQEGVIAKSMSYKQRVSWVIYDPDRVELDRVLSIAGANGEAILINDTEI